MVEAPHCSACAEWMDNTAGVEDDLFHLLHAVSHANTLLRDGKEAGAARSILVLCETQLAFSHRELKGVRKNKGRVGP